MYFLSVLYVIWGMASVVSWTLLEFEESAELFWENTIDNNRKPWYLKALNATNVTALITSLSCLLRVFLIHPQVIGDFM